MKLNGFSVGLAKVPGASPLHSGGALVLRWGVLGRVGNELQNPRGAEDSRILEGFKTWAHLGR